MRAIMDMVVVAVAVEVAGEEGTTCAIKANGWPNVQRNVVD